MIELKHVYKKFNKTDYILKDINLSLPRYGIVVIYGPSGCGKTTLLNVISSLYDFEGEISFNGHNYSLMSEEERDTLRNNKIGFIFQDYKLFEFETVRNNVLLAVDIKSNDKKAQKERRTQELLNIVGLVNKINENVNKLSGGEKQRIAFSRAIVNSPSLVLADEPTGNLDNKNSELIMNLIERLSKNSLVVMVSHDEELTKKYADQIVYMKDGQIEKVEYNNHNRHVDLLPLTHISKKENKPKLPLGFCIKHTLNNIKRRKFRTAFVFLTTSLGLVSVGLGTVLSSIISTSLYKSYSSIIDSNKVILSPKENEALRKEISAYDYDEVISISNDYKDDIDDIGVYYWNNFEKMFTSYSFSISNEQISRVLPDFSINLINEFTDLKDNKNIIYPLQLTNIENDEVILGLTYPTLEEICFQLTIKRTVESFSEYLKSNDLYIDFYMSNANWGYDVSFPIKIKGFSMCKYNCFYHSNNKWNEFIYEEKCVLPSSNLINVNTSNPWDLKKSYYFEFKKERDQFLKDMKFSKTYKDMITEILDKKYYPYLNKDKECEECNRVTLLSINNKQGINGFYNQYIKSVSDDINYLIYGSQNGYAIYPDSLMMGFAKSTYLSNEAALIDEAIDLTAYLKYEDSLNISVPDSVIEGHFAKSNLDGLIFNPSYNLLSGRTPNNYNEIVVSNALINRLNIYEPINKPIYLSFPVIEELLPNGYLKRDYHTIELKIVGVSDSNKLELSHEEEWSIMIFQTRFGVSNIDLNIDTIAMDVTENKEDAIIHDLGRAFPKFKSVCPISSVKDSINKICGYIEQILIILSISSIIISSLLLSICNYLHFVEIKKDIGLIRCIGITKNESSKFIFTHSLILGLLSAIIATIQLLIICLFLSKMLSEMFAISSFFIFNPLSVVIMFSISIIISILSSLVIKKKVNKLNAIDCLNK